MQSRNGDNTTKKVIIMPAKKSPVTVLKEEMMAKMMDENAVFSYYQQRLSANSDNALLELAIQAMASDIKKRFKNGDVVALEQAKKFITLAKRTKGLDNLHKMGGFAYGLIRKYEGKDDGEQVLKMASHLRLFYEQTLSNKFP